MAKTGGVVNYSTFVKGLVTEASPLTFPENATMREENFDLRRDGTRARRLGMDYEASYTQTVTTNKDDINAGVLMSYEWFNAGNSENENFLVVQVGNELHIYDMYTAPISSNKQSFVLGLENYKTNKDTDEEINTLLTKEYPVSVSPLKGNLLVVSPAIEPIFISYDTVTGAFQAKEISVKIRDLVGIADETRAVDHRPTTLSPEHEYNLRNQGWSLANINQTALPAPDGIGVYPSNADMFHMAKQTSFIDAHATQDLEDLGTYNPTLLSREGFGTTPAPKGLFIQNAFRREYKSFSSSSVTTSTAISDISYDATNNELDITATAHGLSVGQSITFKNVGIYVTLKYLVKGYRLSDWQTILVSPEFNTISNGEFVVDTVVSPNVFTVKWVFEFVDERNDVDLVPKDQYISDFDETNAEVVAASTISTVSDNTTAELYRFKAVSGYAGRAWYSGMDGGAYGSYVFFSQILDAPGKLGFCYQEADPTSEHISDLVDTDGGFIVIPEARNIQALVPMGQYLFVFSTNGVWRIFGDDEGNFRATGYSIEKVSDIGVKSRFSIVPVENEIYYWATGGIYKIAQAEVSAKYSATNISQLTIQTLFFDIGSVQHRFVKGSYDAAEKKILWLYNRDPEDSDTDYHYNSILTFDLLLGAFYQSLLPVSVDDDVPFLAGLFLLPDVNVLQQSRNIVAGANNVVAGTSNVASTLDTPRDQVTQTKFLTVSATSATEYSFTFSEFNQIGFLDYKSFDNIGTDAAAYMITGSDVQGSQANKKQVHKLIMYFNRTETGIVTDESGNMVASNPSGCLVNVLWDWATDINSIRAGSQFQAYRLNRYYMPSSPSDSYAYGVDTIVTKSKLRGRGRAFSLAIQSEPGKDLHVYGWSLLASGNTGV